VLGVDDFALRRGHVYATVLIDAETGERVDVLAGRKADALEAWLRDHPGVEIVCREGPAPTARRSGGRCPAPSRPVTADRH
jgi:transposase